LETCSILTTTPNAVTSKIHDDVWLDPGMTKEDGASELLRPYDARQMRNYPVSTRINHVANDDTECSRPVELAQTQSTLF